MNLQPKKEGVWRGRGWSGPVRRLLFQAEPREVKVGCLLRELPSKDFTKK